MIPTAVFIQGHVFYLRSLLRESPNPARRVAPGTPVQVERAAGGREAS